MCDIRGATPAHAGGRTCASRWTTGARREGGGMMRKRGQERENAGAWTAGVALASGSADFRRTMRSTVRLILPFIPVLAFAFAPPADAQYFGRNAVQWDHLEVRGPQDRSFRRLLLPRREAGGGAGRTHGRALVRSLQHPAPPPDEGPPAGHPVRQQLALPADEHPGVLPVRERAASRRPTSGASSSPVGASLAETDHVLGHELVHAFQYDMTGQGKISETNYPSALRMPLWFIEGMAEYLSVGPDDPHTAIRVAARRRPRREKGLPPSSSSTTARSTSLSLRPGPLGLHRLPLRRRGLRAHAARHPAAGERRGGRHQGVLHVDPAALSKDCARGHPRRLMPRRPRAGRTRTPTARPWSRRRGRAGSSTWGPCSVPTATAWPSSPSVTSSPSSCSCRTRRRAT